MRKSPTFLALQCQIKETATACLAGGDLFFKISPLSSTQLILYCLVEHLILGARFVELTASFCYRITLH